ncbi:MAG: response regulator transcription factor [Anaerolineales bacterium]|nr:response regulator transcription factor [Anaerolineales bacterium]MCB9432479.1 response regulator transcription factor [Ardenticatenaceae bacterium]
MATILLVDDDVMLTRVLFTILRGAGHTPLVANTAEDGLSMAMGEKPDLLLLDVMVPNMGGWAVCEQVRRFSQVPIIFLTALGNAENVVKGLELGGDDYIVKPFDEMVLLARVKAHLRRTETAVSRSDVFVFSGGDLLVDLPGHLVEAYGATVDLTPREFELLAYLAQNAGRVVTAQDLVREAWGMEDEAAVDNLKPYIHYLRRKLEKDSTSPRWVTTVRGIGYRLDTD